MRQFALFIIMCLCSAPFSLAASTPSYQAEILLFKDKNEDILSTVRLPTHTITPGKHAVYLAPYFSKEHHYISYLAYENATNIYLSKPVKYDERIADKMGIETYWKQFTLQPLLPDIQFNLTQYAQKLQNKNTEILLHLGWDIGTASHIQEFIIDKDILTAELIQDADFKVLTGKIQVNKNVFFELDTHFTVQDENHQPIQLVAQERMRANKLYFVDRAPYGILLRIQEN